MDARKGHTKRETRIRMEPWTVPGLVKPEPSSLVAADIRASMERGDWRVGQ